MEHTSDTVYDGKLLHETSYPQRVEKNTEIILPAMHFLFAQLRRSSKLNASYTGTLLFDNNTIDVYHLFALIKLKNLLIPDFEKS